MNEQLRAVVVMSMVLGSVALAQPQPAGAPEAAPPVMTAPPAPPMVAPEAATPPGAAAAPAPNAINLADRAQPRRVSRISAGVGGPLFAFSEVLVGLVAGGIIGASLNQPGVGSGSSGAFLGALAGGVVVGGLGIGLQSQIPIGLVSSATVVLGSALGALATFGLCDLASLSVSANTAGWLLLAGTQLGAAIPFLLLMGDKDLRGESLALMGMTSGYAFVLTLLGMSAAGTSGLRVWPLLIAPAVGMGLGGLWAMGSSMAAGRVLKLTALPLGVGLLLFLVGNMTGAGMQVTSIAALIGIAATFGLTYLLTNDEVVEGGAPRAALRPGSILPSFTMASAGRRNEGLAAGPAILVTF